ncbi:unnamed protein product [Didymodactylos carnosus]|uniref:RRM domain-containing protein n=1 Tax=Didymodactylos carnosus TaxID=1234261 RepID=A0A8S2PRL7_9BILA|nr:unnamed protein product [Didymodactylos carnosus]CAF4065977.1 unnamed protein product [Didymodactylos carnosus]
MNNALPATVPDDDEHETYSVHITNLSDDITAEYLSENLRYSIGDILMNPSENECWIRRFERKSVADQLVTNLNSRRICGKAIQCPLETYCIKIFGLPPNLSPFELARELGHSNKNQCRISDTDPSTATIVNQKSLKYAKRLVERCHNKAYPDGYIIKCQIELDKQISPKRSTLLLHPAPEQVEEKEITMEHKVVDNVHVGFLLLKASFNQRLIDYLSKTYRVKVAVEESPTSKLVTIKITGSEKDDVNAKHYLNHLFATVITITYDEKVGM